jgi:hypothetical protein
MNTQRIRMLKTMLLAIQAGTWKPALPVTFSMACDDWQEMTGGTLYGDLIGCAVFDREFIAQGLHLNHSGSPCYFGDAPQEAWAANDGWTALTRFFEADVDTLSHIILPSQYGCAVFCWPQIEQVIERVSSYCEFWVCPVKAAENPSGNLVNLFGPGDEPLATFACKKRAEWMAAAMNDHLAESKGDQRVAQVWGKEA